jgi:toxin ParE1/3/4
LIKAVDYYRSKNPELAKQFYYALDECIENIRQFPEAFLLTQRGVRRARVDGFPYLIYYVVDPDAIFIYALAHNKRDQNYWLGRLGDDTQDTT